MILKLVAIALSAAVSAEVAVTAHEALGGANSAYFASIGARAMSIDEVNDLRQAAANPDESDVHLRRALSKNPWRTANWIQLSVDAEAHGDLAEARLDLEQAAAHDAGAGPRWAAANFYFRQGEEQQFLVWANRYREVTHADEPGLFRMAAENTPDVHALLTSMPNLACDELGTLLDTVSAHDLDPEEVVVKMTSSCHDPASGRAIAHLISNLLREDKSVAARHVQDRLGDEGPLINTTFAQPVSGEGFDWRVNLNDSIQVRQEKNKGIEFEFDDRVPSGTVLIFQPLALQPGARYRLSMNVNSDPPDSDAFRWELVELSTGRHLSSGLDEDNINRIPAWKFQVPQTSKTLALALFYKRSSGELPFQGTLDVEGIGLARELPALPASARP